VSQRAGDTERGSSGCRLRPEGRSWCVGATERSCLECGQRAATRRAETAWVSHKERWQVASRGVEMACASHRARLLGMWEAGGVQRGGNGESKLSTIFESTHSNWGELTCIFCGNKGVLYSRQGTYTKYSRLYAQSESDSPKAMVWKVVDRQHQHPVTTTTRRPHCWHS
jgi:hypothetical protein